MTLHTMIAVTTPGIDPTDAFSRITDLIGATPEQTALATKNGPDPESEYEWERNRQHSIDMPLGLGLPALVNVEYSPTGEALTPNECETNDAEEAYNDEEKMFVPQSYLLIHFDTGYLYETPNGAGCGDLHAWIIREMGAWLTEKGASWDWYDESGRGWSAGRERYAAHDAHDRNISAEWGTLGDPDVGAPDSMTPSVTRDSRQEFLKDVVRPILGF